MVELHQTQIIMNAKHMEKKPSESLIQSPCHTTQPAHYVYESVQGQNIRVLKMPVV